MWTPSVVMIMSFLIGMVYYGVSVCHDVETEEHELTERSQNIYYVPIYMQYVKGYSALTSGALVLAYTLPQSVWGIGAGFFVSKTNRYKLVIVRHV